MRPTKRSIVLLIIFIGILVVTALVFLLRKQGTNPTNDSGYTQVVQLVASGSLKPGGSLYGTAQLPSQYQYLTPNGAIGIDQRNALVILFSYIANRDNTGSAYIYKSDDQPPTNNDFPPLPYPDSFHCDKLESNWFNCQYAWH